MAFCDDAEGFGALLTFWFGEMEHVELVGATRTYHDLAALLEHTPVDVLLLDLVLPGVRVDREHIASVRALAPDARVVLMSSLPGEALRERARDLGADASWSKAEGAEVLRHLLA